MERLLQEDPGARLGAARVADLRAHPFFEGVDWAAPGGARGGAAPAAAPPRVQSGDEVALDWELSSLFRPAGGGGGGGGVYYEYLPSPGGGSSGEGGSGGGGGDGAPQPAAAPVAAAQAQRA